MNTQETSQLAPDPSRLEDLLALEQLGLLDESELRELSELRGRFGPAGRVERGLREAVGSLLLTATDHDAAPLDPALFARLEKLADEHLGMATQQPRTATEKGPRLVASKPATRLPPRKRGGGVGGGNGIGWLVSAGGYALAACLLLALLVRWGGTGVGSPVDPAVELQRISALPGTTTLAWSAQGSMPGAAGQVVWSQSEQRGFMTFAGLRSNEPGKSQYQLWIFDADRPEATPVDGGVFDIPQDGTAVVPILAKLPVGKPTLFAITEEKPGGVVVSDRSRLHLIAAVR
jgi:hypothetical protein